MTGVVEEQKPFSMLRCEVCKGRGTVNWGKEICHACKGKGYILIDNLTGLVVGEKKDEEIKEF